MAEPFDHDVYVDSNGCLTERISVGDTPVTIHYDDVPETDITTVQGIRCTTALRTVIDLAPDMDFARLANVVDDCLRRSLFTVEEARARLSQDDMLCRPGAERLRRVLPR